MQRRDWIGMGCGLALAFVMGAADCEPSPPPDGSRFCAGESRGVVDDVVRDLKGEWNVILGGFEADDYYATVLVDIVGEGYCSGTVIAPHAVLTAGHCAGEGGYRIYQDRVRHPDTFFSPSRAVLHPGYYRWASATDEQTNERGEPHDDLLLLFFDEPLPMKPVAGIYDRTAMSALCDATFGQGWGQYKRSDAPPPPGYEYIPCEDGGSSCLQESPLYVEKERNTDVDTKVPGWGGICFGDSGGPLYARLQDGTLYLAGVTSTTSASNCVGYDWGDGFNQAHGTHVKLGPNYLPWIDRELRDFYQSRGIEM